MRESLRLVRRVASRALRSTRIAVLCTGVCGGAALAVADEPVELTFAPTRVVQGGGATPKNAAADFDGDGDIDVATVDGGSILVKVARNNGAGDPPFEGNGLVLPEMPNGVDTADFNQDGRPDLVISAPTGIYVAFNDGVDEEGTLSFSVSIRYHSNAPQYVLSFEGVRAADLTGDGFPEFVAYGFEPAAPQSEQGFVLTFQNYRSNGPFGWFGPVGLTPGQLRYSDLAVGELTGDVFADYVLASAESDAVTVVLNGDASGGFDTTSYAVLQKPTGVAIADLTGDGHPEVVVVGHFHASGTERLAVDVLVNKPFGTIWGTLEHAGGSTYAQTAALTPVEVREDIAVGDFDGDDTLELVVTESLNNAVTVLRLTPQLDAFGGVTGFDRVQTSFPAASAEFPAARPEQLLVADVDGDGCPDIVVAHMSESYVTGTGTQLLVNTTDCGVVVLPPTEPAQNLGVKSKKYSGGVFQAGKKFTFTAVQPLRDVGVTVRVQSSTSPTFESSWSDLGGDPYMARPAGRSAVWTLKTSRVLGGRQWFRTVTEAPGRDPGVNTQATGDAGYVGPFEVQSSGALLVSSCTVTTLSDPTGKTTHIGDQVTFLIKLENEGDAAAVGATVRAHAPHRTSIESVVGTHVIDDARVSWEPFDLAAGATVYRLFTVTVGADARVDVVFQNLDFQAPGRTAVRSAPCVLRIGSPVYANLSTGSATVTPGDTISYSLVGRNGSSFVLGNAFMTDTLPDDTGFEDAWFLDGSGARTNPPVANPRGGSNPAFDPVTRIVTWYLGDVAAGTSRSVRLEVRVQYDRASTGKIRNGAYGLFGCSGLCNPLDLNAFDQTSGEPTDVFTNLSGSPAQFVPVLRLDQFDTPDRAGRLNDPIYGDVGTVLPGGEVEYAFFLKNTGTTSARGIRLSGNLPNGVGLVTGSVKAEGNPHAFTLSTGGTLDLFLGDLSPGGSRRITYRVSVRADARLRTFLVGSGFNVRTESLSGVLHATPLELRTQIVTPVSFEIETHTSRTNFDLDVDVDHLPEGEKEAAREAGKVMTFLSLWRNNGDEAGSNVVITQALPFGTHLHPNPIDAISFSTDFAGTVAESLTGKKGKPDTVVFRIPRAEGHAEGFVRVTVRMDQQPSGGEDEVIAKATITGVYAPAAKSGDPVGIMSAAATVSIPIDGGTQTRIFVGKSARLTGQRATDITYMIFWGNLGDVAATNVKVLIDTPLGTEFNPFDELKAKKGTVTLNLGTLAPHSSGSRSLTFHVATDFKGCTIVEDSCRIEAANATTKCAPPLATFLLLPNQDFSAFAWEGFGCYLQKQKMKLKGVDVASLEAEVRKLTSSSFATSIGGADILTLMNGTFVVPLGDGKVLAGGTTGIEFRAGTSFSNVDGGFTLAGGTAGLIDLKFVPGQALPLSASAALADPLALIASRAANMVASGGGNLIGNDGGTLIANDGGTLIGNDGGTLVAQGGGNIVASGGGNIVASGGGNIVASGGGNLVATDGASLVATDGASLVAQGGGNLVAISNGFAPR